MAARPRAPGRAASTCGKVHVRDTGTIRQIEQKVANRAWDAGRVVPVAGPGHAAVAGWSDWCEFTVAAGLVDPRGATDVLFVRELGVAPARRCPVELTVRQWRLVLEATGPADGVTIDGGLRSDAQVEASDRPRRISTAARGLGHDR